MSMEPSSLPPRQPYRFGPFGLLVRYRRWHATAPLWQIVVLTVVQLVLIALVWSGALGMLPR